jgi:putative transposase
MARPLRIEYEGAYYHITSRGNERKAIFKTERDREKFLSYLESATERYGAMVHVYCLMSNHYHVLMQTPRGNLSQIMRHINGAYTTYYNVKRQRSGHLLQGRYRAVLVEMDAYAQELSRYIHLNPVRAGIVKKPEKYPWSSYRHYIGETKPGWLQTKFILNYFDRDTAAAQKKYRGFVESMAGRSCASPLEAVACSTVLGGENFLKTVWEQYLSRKPADRHVPALRALADKPTLEQVSAATDKVLKGNDRLSKKAALYLCRRYTGKRLKEIGERFGLSESAVSQASRRIEMQLSTNAGLKKQLEEIERELGLSRV